MPNAKGTKMPNAKCQFVQRGHNSCGSDGDALFWVVICCPPSGQRHDSNKYRVSYYATNWPTMVTYSVYDSPQSSNSFYITLYIARCCGIPTNQCNQCQLYMSVDIREDSPWWHTYHYWDHIEYWDNMMLSHQCQVRLPSPAFDPTQNIFKLLYMYSTQIIWK
jgi:hypothetical protein